MPQNPNGFRGKILGTERKECHSRKGRQKEVAIAGGFWYTVLRKRSSRKGSRVFDAGSDSPVHCYGKPLPLVLRCLPQKGEKSLEYRKNQILPLTVTGSVNSGSGVGHTPDGLTVFVPFTAVGDEIECRLLKVQKRYAFGKAERLLVPSPDRIPDPGCPVYGKCGGCAWRHIGYEAECRYKQRQVADAFGRIGGITAKVQPTVGGEPSRYRNKAQFPVRGKAGDPHIGFYAPRSHRLVEIEDCPLQPEAFAGIQRAVKMWMRQTGAPPYDETAKTGLVRHLYLRFAEETGEIMLCLVCTGGNLPDVPLLLDLAKQAAPKLSVCVNINRRDTNVILGDSTFPLYGEPAVTDRFCGLTVRLSVHSFYQVNRRQAMRLMDLAARAARPQSGDVLLDLYCGTGTIGLSMARKVREVIGVETVSQAVEDARRNARENGITNARFLCADAAGAARELASQCVRPDIAVIDPPRKGCDPQLIETVCEMSPSRVVYISCDPATLARDCSRFAAHGYTPGEVIPVDLFPRTRHVETVVLMSRVREPLYEKI